MQRRINDDIKEQVSEEDKKLKQNDHTSSTRKIDQILKGILIHFSPLNGHTFSYELNDDGSRKREQLNADDEQVLQDYLHGLLSKKDHAKIRKLNEERRQLEQRHTHHEQVVRDFFRDTTKEELDDFLGEQKNSKHSKPCNLL